MIYNGYFRQVNTDDLYTVRLTTQDGTSSKEITLGGEPFTTTMDESSDTLYEPIKCQKATVQIVTEDYLFDIYSSKAQDTKVELIKGNEILWVGYATPNLYDMGFERRRELVEIEVGDALTTLQYIPYRTDSKQTRTFLYIINKLIKSCNAYKGFYFSDNIRLYSATDETILDKLYISESNFFDEKNANETDDDVAWKCDEVLEEICRFLGVTAIADKEYVYFIDYDAIRNDNNNYWFYSIDGGNGTQIELSYNKAVKAKDYSANGATISLDNVYNKISVKAELNDYDSIIPSMFDNLTNITSDTDPYVTTLSEKKRGEIIKSTLGDSENKNLIILIDNSFLLLPECVAVKYFNNPNYKLFKYENGVDVTDSVTSLNYSDTKTMHGATIAKFYTQELDGSADEIFNPKKTIDEVLVDNKVNNISLSNYVMLVNCEDSYHIPNSQITNYPYLQTTVTDTSALYGGDNTYLIISGSYVYSPFNTWPFPYNGDKLDIGKGRYKLNIEDCYLLCKLQWGGLYWDGNAWVTTDTTFKLPYLKTTNKEERRADHTMFKDLSFVSTINWRIGTSESGYCIQCPTNYLLEGIPVLTVYKPYDPNYEDHGQTYKHSVVFLKDFEIKAVIGNPTYSDTNNTDTEYTITINDEFTNDFSEVSMKINTWDNKKPNYSSVALRYDTSYAWLNKTYNTSLMDEVKGLEYLNENNVYVTSDGSLRQEWWLCYRLYKQYSTPSTILKLNLRNDLEIYGLYTVHNLEGKIFIVDSINKDYKNNSTEVKLIEKK